MTTQATHIQTTHTNQQQQLKTIDTTYTTNVAEYLQAALASSTQKAYLSDIKHFMRWGGVIPSSPEQVAEYLATQAKQLSIATLNRRVIAISKAHTLQNFISPTSTDLVKATLKGIKRINGCAQRQVLPALKQDIQAMVKGMTGVKGMRDRALLLTGFAGAFRRSELVALQITDLQFVNEGVLIQIRRSKTDQLGLGRSIAIPYAKSRLCPVRALLTWLKVAAITEGYLFRRVDRHCNILAAGITGQSVAMIVKERASVAGLDAAQYSGHSLRAGLATSAAKAGVSGWKIRQQTGHKSDAMLSRYIRDANIFADNAAGRVL